MVAEFVFFCLKLAEIQKKTCKNMNCTVEFAAEKGIIHPPNYKSIRRNNQIIGLIFL